MITRGFGSNTIVTRGFGSSLIEKIILRIPNAVHFIRSDLKIHFFDNTTNVKIK